MMPGVTKVNKRVRLMACKLLDDMCANMQLIKSFCNEDIDEVAISLQELLEDEDLVKPEP